MGLYSLSAIFQLHVYHNYQTYGSRKSQIDKTNCPPPQPPYNPWVVCLGTITLESMSVALCLRSDINGLSNLATHVLTVKVYSVFIKWHIL